MIIFPATVLETILMHKRSGAHYSEMTLGIGHAYDYELCCATDNFPISSF